MTEREIIRSCFRMIGNYKRLRHSVMEAESKKDPALSGLQGHGRTLSMLAQDGPMTQNELAARLEIRPQSLTSAMSRLEEEGYVKRERDPKDRRQLLVSVTEKGRTQSRFLEESREKTAVQMLSQLSPAEKEELLRLLSKALSPKS